eukprot:s923_g17.t1
MNTLGNEQDGCRRLHHFSLKSTYSQNMGCIVIGFHAPALPFAGMIDGDSEQASLTEGSVAQTPDQHAAVVGQSARSVSSVDSPLQPSSVEMAPRLTSGAGRSSKAMTSSPSQSRIRESSGPSAPRRRASGLARPPLEGRWLQRVEACNGLSERPSSAASSVRGSPGSARSDTLPARALTGARSGQANQRRSTPSRVSRPEANRVKSQNCDKLEEEVLSIMSVLQKPRDPSPWSFERTDHHAGSNGMAILRTRSPRATTPRRSSPSPRDPYLRTAERAVARVTSEGQTSGHVSLSERARQASSSHTRTTRPKMSQSASRGMRSGSSSAELPGRFDTSLGKSGRTEGLLRLSRALGEAQRALELETAEALRRPHETSGEEAKALEAFAEKLHRQLAEAQNTSRALEEQLAGIAMAKNKADARRIQTVQDDLNELKLSWRGNGTFTPAPIPEEAEETDLEKTRSIQDEAAEWLQVSSESKKTNETQKVSRTETSSGNGIKSEGEETLVLGNTMNTEKESDATASLPMSQEALDGCEPSEVVANSCAEGEVPEVSSPLGAGVKEQEGEIPPAETQDQHNESEHLWEFVVQGHTPMEENADLPDTDRKTISCFPSNAVAKLIRNGVACVCARGQRVDPRVPNQDDLVLAMCSWGSQGRVALYGVFDGHGPAGHRCAALARGFLPERIFGDPDLLTCPREVLKAAFIETQAEMLRLEPSESLSSGTTATVAVVLEAGVSSHQKGTEPSISVHTAHVGDSRAILARVSDGANGSKCFIVKELTKDHRPDDQHEAQRVKDAGGHIRLAGGKRARVICDAVPGHPGFALTRSLGLAIGQDCGIIAEPQVSSVQLAGDAEALLVLGTDGLFEFCGNRTVAGHLLKHGVNDRALEEVVHESMELWKANSSNGTVDDATAIAASLGRLAKSGKGSFRS